MKQLSILILVIILSDVIHAQTITPVVIASTGNNYNSGDLFISYTVGELAVTWANGGGSGTIGITQGFHQQEEFINTDAVKSIPYQEINITIYPNPVDNTLWLEYKTQIPGSVSLDLYNSMGLKIMERKVN